MESSQKKIFLEELVKQLELPESAYQKAEERYNDLSEWLERDGSMCAVLDPHIFPQGSFRLGTAIYPLDSKEEYDLDLSCKFRKGITVSTHSQKSLKELLGKEIEAYRAARGIKEEKEEKNRCWRLYYADKLSFHMDIVPSIPANEVFQKRIMESMKKTGINQVDAESMSRLAVYITDKRLPNYSQINSDWPISNPEGYALWFETQMNKQKRQVLFEARAKVDSLPVYKRKTPLQRIIQLLKRHRDQMFVDDPDVKPISIIITTLAARAYEGEMDIESALNGILSRMVTFIHSQTPKVPNPVDPNEDFADRWSMEEGKKLHLEENFGRWIQQARADFNNILSSNNTQFLFEQAQLKFKVGFNTDNLSKKLGLVNQSSYSPKAHTIQEPSKPWSNEQS